MTFKRVKADGWLDISDRRRVRTPGNHNFRVEPIPEKEAVAFLLSHTFPGHRRIVRRLTKEHRRRLRLALWSDSVSERMNLVDRVWRAITEPARVPLSKKPELIQVVHYGDEWAYPMVLDAESTRVLPSGGIPLGELNGQGKAPAIELKSMPAVA